MGYFIGAVLAHVIDLAGLLGLIAGLFFKRRRDVLGVALILAALASLWAPGLLANTHYTWRLATNLPATLLVASITHMLRHRKRNVNTASDITDDAQ